MYFERVYVYIERERRERERETDRQTGRRIEGKFRAQVTTQILNSERERYRLGSNEFEANRLAGYMCSESINIRK